MKVTNSFIYFVLMCICDMCFHALMVLSCPAPVSEEASGIWLFCAQCGLLTSKMEILDLKSSKLAEIFLLMI